VAALRVVKFAGGSGLRLYFYIALLTATISILFANDSAVLILTPIVLEIVTCLGIDKKGKLAYLFTAGLIADTAAMPLITSNPINILSADFFKYSFLDHLVFMGPVAIATLLSSLLLIHLFFRKRIPITYDVKAADALTRGKPAISSSLLRIILVTLIAIHIGYVLTSLSIVPVSLVICSGAVFLVAVYWFALKRNGSVSGEKKGLLGLAKDINLDIVLFMLSIFIVVQGLEAAGVTNLLASALTTTSKFPSVLGVFAPSMVVTVGQVSLTIGP
jgi:arsenical pump membrane protein